MCEYRIVQIYINSSFHRTHNKNFSSAQWMISFYPRAPQSSLDWRSVAVRINQMLTMMSLFQITATKNMYWDRSNNTSLVLVPDLTAVTDEFCFYNVKWEDVRELWIKKYFRIEQPWEFLVRNRPSHWESNLWPHLRKTRKAAFCFKMETSVLQRSWTDLFQIARCHIPVFWTSDPI